MTSVIKAASKLADLLHRGLFFVLVCVFNTVVDNRKLILSFGCSLVVQSWPDTN